jgi:hypothetical protein
MPADSGTAPSPHAILQALERTGFLLEQRVAQKIQDAGFAIIINDAFPDPDSGKSREMDVVGTISYALDDSYVRVGARVIVECKNYATPLVLVGTDRVTWPIRDESIYLSFDPYDLRFRGHEFSSVLSDLNLKRLPGYELKETFVGYQLVKMEHRGSDWRADNSDVHDAILYPLVKARQYQIELDSSERAENEHGVKPWEFPFLGYYFPVILTTGDIYTVTVSTDDPSLVTKVEWATLGRRFNARDLSTSLRADVVTFNYLDKYIRTRVLATVENAFRVLQDNAQLYNPEWLLDNFGRPEQDDKFAAWLEHYSDVKSLSQDYTESRAFTPPLSDRPADSQTPSGD